MMIFCPMGSLKMFEIWAENKDNIKNSPILLYYFL